MATGLISNIQRFSVDDGPGIRTTVFFKGCNLKCVWCHNPECIPRHKSLNYDDSRCVRCEKCSAACVNGVHVFEKSKDGTRHLLLRERCGGCGRCADVCPGDALKEIGKKYSVEELLKALDKDAPFYQSSNGGITLSGGEPMLQLEFLQELLLELKRKNYHVAVDTAGCVDFAYFEAIMDCVDLFLYDVKMVSEEKHRAYTGVSNRRILENLRKLVVRKDVFVRVPVIPDINDDAMEIAKIISFLQALPKRIKQVKLLPYHSYGLGKYDLLGLSPAYQREAAPDDQKMTSVLSSFLSGSLPAIC